MFNYTLMQSNSEWFIKKEAWTAMPRLYVKVVGLPYAKMWIKQLHAL